MLEIIIGHNYTKDVKVCDKTLSYVKKLEKGILIMTLNGEYTKLKDKKYDNERYYPVITIFRKHMGLLPR